MFDKQDELVANIESMDEEARFLFLQSALTLSRCYKKDSNHHALILAHDGDNAFQMFGVNVCKEEAHALALMAMVNTVDEEAQEQEKTH
jgi:hypothetical protein